MTMGRIIRNGDGFEFVELDELEQDEIIRCAIDRNLNLYTRVEKSVQEHLLATHMHDPSDLQRQLALAIFEVVAVRANVLLRSELSRKIHWTKEGQG
ncbi:MAG: hypothetical protein ABII79_05590 [bacterium]